MNYNKTIKVLTAISKEADQDMKKELDSAIELLKKNSEDEKTVIATECKYNHDGLCWGQKGTPECTAGYGYCPLVKETK